MKLSRWCLIAGLLLLAAGLIVYSITNVWQVKSLVIIGLGCGLTAFALIRLDLKKFLRDRRLIYGGNMIVIIVLVIAILGMINFFLARHTWRVDTTAGKTFSLSPQTVKILNNLKEDLGVLAFDKQMNKGSIEDLLKEYAHISSHFKWQMIDPDEKPAIAKQYKIKQYGNLVVISGSREEQISTATEEALTNAIIKVTRAKTKKVAFISGHGELSTKSTERDGFTDAKTAIEDQNYAVTELLLAGLDSIPEDISVIIIPGPHKDFFQGELDLITHYLEHGGGALFLLDPPPGNGLTKYMCNWHVSIGNDLVVDASGFGRLLGAGPEVPLVSSYGDHPSVKDLNGLMTFFPLTRSVKPIESEDSRVAVITIAETGPNSYAIDPKRIKGEEDIAINPDDQRGPISIACATTIEQQDGNKTRIVTVGDGDFASNAYFASQANGDFFLNIVSWLMADEDLISIRPHDPELRLVNTTPAQMRIVFWLVVIILPLAAFGTAILVFVRRR
jgi:ABC-type uncharacterized transport system involved in gliding motility auxiliary subunit